MCAAERALTLSSYLMIPFVAYVAFSRRQHTSRRGHRRRRPQTVKVAGLDRLISQPRAGKNRRGTSSGKPTRMMRVGGRSKALARDVNHEGLRS